MRKESISNLITLLQSRAACTPDRTVYSFIREDLSLIEELTFGALDLRARAVAAFLQVLTMPGDRILLTYPFGSGFLEGFFGSIYAGRIPVPLYSPRTGRTKQTFKAICDDSQAKMVLTDAEHLQRVKQALTQNGNASEFQCSCTAEVPNALASSWAEPDVRSTAIAFLQYTSGSTGKPKGVMVSHGNIIHNERMIQEAFSETETSIVVSWLPLFHDMGLIGTVLQPLWVGSRCVLMSPQTFVQNPLRWLEAISRFRATTSGGPDFGYRLCVDKIAPEGVSSLDLSSWKVAFNGSEPVKATTLTRFADKFAPAGFNKSAFVPCYGLAESTLLVTARRTANEVLIKSLEGEELEYNHVVPCAEGDIGSRQLVGCGVGSADQVIRTMNLQTGLPCSPGEVGEIWVSGPHVAQGYWNNSEETTLAFNNNVLGDEAKYLCTGDLGFILDGELFVTGRSRDLIVLRGRNFYPQDFETIAAQSHPALRSELGAAFMADTEAEPEVVLIQETQARTLDFQSLCRIIRESMVKEFEVSPGNILFVPLGALPRTSSGKVKRQESKARFQKRELKVLFDEAGSRSPSRALEDLDAGASKDDNIADIRYDSARRQAYLVQLIRRSLRSGSVEIDPHVPLLALGMDSLAAGELTMLIARELGAHVSLESLLAGANLEDLCTLVAQQQPSSAAIDSSRKELSRAGYPLSQGQLAIWYLSRLSPASAAYNISVALQCSDEMKEEILKEAFEDLMSRHDALRTVIRSGDEGPYQLLMEQSSAPVAVVNADDWSEEYFQDALSEAANQPFQVEGSLLFRITVFRKSEHVRVVLFVFHHLIVDFLSLELMLQELGAIYGSLSRGQVYEFATKAGCYADYVDWQRSMLNAEYGTELKKFWHEQLSGELAVTELPTVRARPAVQTDRGASCSFRIDSVTTKVIIEQARTLGVTLYSMLLAGFQLLLHRYTGQGEVTIGSPVSGRLSSRWEQTIGLFVNQIALRGRISKDMKACDLIRSVHKGVSAALENQEYPFSLLVEQLRPRRDPSHSPLFQTLFSFYRSRKAEYKGLEAFILGIPGVNIPFGALKVTSMAIEQKTAQLDLTLALAEIGSEFRGVLQFNADLFDSDFMEEFGRNYVSLIETISRDPELRISETALIRRSDGYFANTPAELVAQQRADECVQHLVMAQVSGRASATAIVARQDSLTYGELGVKALALAGYLSSQGIGPDVPVAIFASRSVLLLTGMLGTLLAGATFVPIDPSVPPERAALMVAESRAQLFLTEEKLRAHLPKVSTRIIYLDHRIPEGSPPLQAACSVRPENLAYILFTSGSTGKPKGVMITHGNLTSFCKAMECEVCCGPGDVFYASTSISFDISILELLWPLTRGAQVTLLPEDFKFGGSNTHGGSGVRHNMDFSVFYFASVDESGNKNKYKLMVEGAKYADRNGFCAVWTPERHFHEFGGLFPNPSITSAALATITERVALRGGSVVLPLHNPIRVAEEWSVVDNLSGGRVGIALASGWHADDFTFFPAHYEGRKEVLFGNISTLQRLWKGDAISVQGGNGKTIDVRIFPKPIQSALPIWITAAGSAETFRRAGEIGAHILTHLLGQSVEKLAAGIRTYREARLKSGHDPDAGKVTLMLHTFLGADLSSVRDSVRAPFKNYLRSSVDLIGNLVRSEGLDVDINGMKPKDFDDLLSFAFDRYFETSALFGTVRSCEATVNWLKEIGVTEVGCLIDFGVPAEDALNSLREVTELMDRQGPAQQKAAAARDVALNSRSRRILQCTPSMARVLLSDIRNREFLDEINLLLLGGESLPRDLAEEAMKALPHCKIVNMYGPTETTIWSATHPLDQIHDLIPIGSPIANTAIHILDDYGKPVPIGVKGEIYIGGNGLARGYVNSPGITAQRFVPDPFSRSLGARMYRTGDIGRYKRDGVIEFLGRNDSQVKIRGFRIELGEVESTLGGHPRIQQCAVSVSDRDGAKSIIAHIVLRGAPDLKAEQLRRYLKHTLPEYMVPSHFIFLERMPLTTSGKIDRKNLPDFDNHRPLLESMLIRPRDEVENGIAVIWRRALRTPDLGIDDNFFDLGGHSLLMVQIHAAIEEQFQKDIPLIKLLEHPTIRSLAAYMHGMGRGDSTGAGDVRAMKQRAALSIQRNAARTRSTA